MRLLPALSFNRKILLAAVVSLLFPLFSLFLYHLAAPSSLAAPDCSGCDECCACLWKGGFCDWYCVPCGEPPEGGGGGGGEVGNWHSRAYFYWDKNKDGWHQEEEPVVISNQAYVDQISASGTSAIFGEAYFHHTNSWYDEYQEKDKSITDYYNANNTLCANSGGIITVYNTPTGGACMDDRILGFPNHTVFPFGQTNRGSEFRIGGIHFEDYDTGAARPVYQYKGPIRPGGGCGQYDCGTKSSCPSTRTPGYTGLACYANYPDEQRYWSTTWPCKWEWDSDTGDGKCECSGSSSCFLTYYSKVGVVSGGADIKSERDFREGTNFGSYAEDMLLVQVSKFKVDYSGSYYLGVFPSRGGAGSAAIWELSSESNGKQPSYPDRVYSANEISSYGLEGTFVCSARDVDHLYQSSSGAGYCNLSKDKTYALIAKASGVSYGDARKWAWPFLAWVNSRLTAVVPDAPNPVAAIPLVKPVSLGCVSKTLQVGGTGLLNQPGEINLNIAPAPGDNISPSVSRSRLYWDYKTLMGMVDNDAYVNQLDPAAPFSGRLAGTLLGPLLTFPNNVHSTSYAYGTDFTNQTTLSNKIHVSEVYNEGTANQISNEASLAVTLEVDPQWSQTLQTYEANDWFFWDFPLWHGPDSGNSDVYQFDLCQEAEDPGECAAALDFPRKARLTLLIGGRDRNNPRSSMLWLWTGSQPLEEGVQVIDHPEAKIISENPLYRGVGYNGDEFNGIILESGEEGMIEIPAGHRYVSVQMECPLRGKYPGTDYENWSGESTTIVFAALETSCLPDQGLFPYTERTVLPASVSGPFPMCADADASGGPIDSGDIRLIVGDMNSDSLSFGEPRLGDVNNDGVVNSLDFSLSVKQQGTVCDGSNQ